MASRYSRPPVYHARASREARNEALCRAMHEALDCYNGLVNDIAYGKDFEDIETFVDVDNYTWYCAAEVSTPLGREDHHVPDDFAGLVVCYCYIAVCEVPTVDDGADFISLATGRLISLLPEPDNGSERWWMPHPIDGDGPGPAPTEPPPDHPIRRSLGG